MVPALWPVIGQTAYTETTLWSFSGSDGAAILGELFARNESASPKKTFYGTTGGGGSNNCFFGCGTVFSLTDGRLTTLWSFTGGSDGNLPDAGLIAGEESGTLYGTTFGGGSSNCSQGCGTVFAIGATPGSLSTIWSFSGSDGANPGGPLLLDKAGALYGTAGVALSAMVLFSS
jgi:uncharacterized repeat protein (TIGR03803 family)